MTRPVIPIFLLSFALFLSSVSARPPTELATACNACRFAVNVLHNLWGSDATEECLGELVTFICTTLKIEDHFICAGISNGFKDEFVWIIGQVLIQPDELCGLFIKDCGHFENPLNDSWNLTIPAGKPPHPDTPPFQFKKPTLKVVHISDLHIDRLYTPGMEVECSEPQCCRPQQNPDEIVLRGDGSVASDDVKKPAGKWGSVGSCDAPYWLYTNMLDHIVATHTNIDYVVVSGDLESHADWDYTRERHQDMVKNSSDTIRNKIKDVPVFFAVGNHEGVPINNFAPHFTPERFHMDWLYGTMAESWKEWVPADQTSTVWYNACFMRKLFPGLRLISLNNGLGDSMNFYLYVNATDPDGTLTWFANQLLDAEKAGDKVHVVAHIPGASSELREGWSINFYKLINRFEDTVVAQFMGHEHSEEFNIYYEDPNDAKSRATAVSWSAPSLTPYSEFNPAYRVYSIEGNYPASNFRVLDWEEYYLDLEQANQSDKPEWKALYKSVLDEYGLNDASPAEWSHLIDRMNFDDNIFQKYRKNFYRRDTGGHCDANCKRGFLCSARKSHHNDDLCKDLPAGNNASSDFRPTSRSSKRRPAVVDVQRMPTREEVISSARAIFAKRKFMNNRLDDEKCKLPF